MVKFYGNTLTGIFVLFCLLFFFTLGGKSYAFFFKSEDRVKSYVVIDYNTGEVLSESNSSERMYPASLTKLMTLFILFDKLDDGSLTLDTKIKISPAAAALPPSKLGLPAGSTIAVKDALVSIIVRSNNDIALAVAEHIGGSQKGFVDMMNAKAQELGLSGTHFANPHGLTDKNNYSTAYDLAKLSRVLMVHHNAYYSLFSISDFNWNKTRYNSTNHLLDYNGIDGIKTGYTSASGFNLVTSASKDNTRIIAVVMGFYTANGRDDYMKQVIDIGFEIADVSRKNEVAYLAKPDVLKNAISEQPSVILAAKQENLSDSYAMDSDYSLNLANIQSETNNLYTIDRVPYIDNLNSDKIKISPTVKYVPASKNNKKTAKNTKAKGNYAVQVGAFSNYEAALRVSYNVALVKATSSVLKKNNVAVVKKDNMFIAKFTGLSKDQAQNSCKTLKSKGTDCFVVAG
ncbi:MAG: D-alanyl-D-alanine carboxypeptidase [Alphaproteobacteria bacterium]|jgi:D-alanyl-D-alanine carboxypeptidase|nr:D-alanyl-D-alanine carboxypeptidase [Alphaproteobacteria bacterium]